MCMKHMTKEEICGDYSGEDTPVPIPNTEVKLLSADDTWRATSWESKTLPLFLFLCFFELLRYFALTLNYSLVWIGNPKCQKIAYYRLSCCHDFVL